MPEALSKSSAPRRFNLILLMSFAAFAWLLSAEIGMYGTVAYSVAERTREVGIRLTLGAQLRHVLRGVLATALVPAVLGTAAGIPLAMAFSGYMRSLLVAVSPTDLATMALSALVLVLTAALAAFIPGRKALRSSRPSLCARNESPRTRRAPPLLPSERRDTILIRPTSFPCTRAILFQRRYARPRLVPAAAPAHAGVPRRGCFVDGDAYLVDLAVARSGPRGRAAAPTRRP